MGSKLQPGVYDCYQAAMEDEPMFTLLARDSNAPEIVRTWAKRRQYDVQRGMRPHSDLGMVQEALDCARDMEAWRTKNLNAWKKENQKSPTQRIQELEEGMIAIRHALGMPTGTRHYAEGGVIEIISKLLPEQLPPPEPVNNGASTSMKSAVR